MVTRKGEGRRGEKGTVSQGVEKSKRTSVTVYTFNLQWIK